MLSLSFAERTGALVTEIGQHTEYSLNLPPQYASGSIFL